jgi:hypothetical protein
MKIDLAHREANLVMAILYELATEHSTVNGSFEPLWRLTDHGRDICQTVMDKLEEANDKQVRKTGKDRDLSGAPKGSLQEATWSA